MNICANILKGMYINITKRSNSSLVNFFLHFQKETVENFHTNKSQSYFFTDRKNSNKFNNINLYKWTRPENFAFWNFPTLSHRIFSFNLEHYISGSPARSPSLMVYHINLYFLKDELSVIFLIFPANNFHGASLQFESKTDHWHGNYDHNFHQLWNQWCSKAGSARQTSWGSQEFHV